MLEKIVRGGALTLFIGSALFLALSALGAGSAFGGLAGWASLSLLHILAPRYFALSSWSLAFVGGGAIVGGLGALLGLGRWLWETLKQSSDPALLKFTGRIEKIKKIWRATST